MTDLDQLEHQVRAEYLAGERTGMSLKLILDKIDALRDKRAPRGFSANTKTSKGICPEAAPYIRAKIAERRWNQK
jgi:hypothetical protein